MDDEYEPAEKRPHVDGEPPAQADVFADFNEEAPSNSNHDDQGAFRPELPAGMPENPFEEADRMDADEQPDGPSNGQAAHFAEEPSTSATVDPVGGYETVEMAQSHVPDGRTLGDFMNHLKNIQPVIPDAVALHVMRKNGLNSDDPRIVRLISLATQKFISDIALDAMQLSQIKGLGVRKTGRPTRFVLTADADGVLPTVLQEYGIQMPSNPPANDR